MADLTNTELQYKLLAKHKEGVLATEFHLTEYEVGLVGAVFLHHLAGTADESDRARLLDLCVLVVDRFNIPSCSPEDYTDICNDLLEKFRVNILSIITQE